MALIDLVTKTKAYAADVMTNFQKMLVMHVFNEDLTPLVIMPGPPTTYSTAARFVPGTLRVYRAGLRLRRGGAADYVETTDIDGQGVSFTLNSTPTPGTALVVDYQVSGLDV